jgi:hypothetical protein
MGGMNENIYGITIRFNREQRRRIGKLASQKRWSVAETARFLVESALSSAESETPTGKSTRHHHAQGA